MKRRKLNREIERLGELIDGAFTKGNYSPYVDCWCAAYSALCWARDGDKYHARYSSDWPERPNLKVVS